MPASAGLLSLDPGSVPDSLEGLILPCSGLLIMVCIWQMICLYLSPSWHAEEEAHLCEIAKMQRCGGRGSTGAQSAKSGIGLAVSLYNAKDGNHHDHHHHDYKTEA